METAYGFVKDRFHHKREGMGRKGGRRIGIFTFTCLLKIERLENGTVKRQSKDLAKRKNQSATETKYVSKTRKR